MKQVVEHAASLPVKTKWYGNHAENEKQIALKAGQLSMVYERGNLRRISSGNYEVLRMIYPAVRNKEWLTIIPVISEEEFILHPDSFIVRYKCQYISGNIIFSASFSIEGNTDSSLIFKFEGEALRSFEKNRIGFCVLHPIRELAGKNCLITHSNNETENYKFPNLINPCQPFRDITSMKWDIAGNAFKLDFYGDVFETEDQRNWSDASYKTYCTPLEIPFPVTLNKGDRISQRIELKAELDSGQQKTGNEKTLITVFPEELSDLPMIGIGRTTRREPLTEPEIRILKNLRFDHYRVDLYLFDSGWKVSAGFALTEAASLEYPLEFALFFDENTVKQAADFVAWLSAEHVNTALICLFHKTIQSTPNQLTESVAPLLRDTFPGIRICCGTNASFVQLNRSRPESTNTDLICYSIHPQEHASDNTTLVENLQAQGYTVDSARNFANGKGIWISTVNLQRRFNPTIENYETAFDGDKFPPQVDSRLMSLFGACWTAGSMKYLFEAGIKGATFLETAGERGIIQGDFPSRWPEKFQSVKGMIFPVFHLFRYILKNKSLKVIRSVSSHPLNTDILTLSDGRQLKIILANFTSGQQDIILKSISGEFTIKQLNAENYAEAAGDYNWIESAPAVPVNLNEKIILEPFSLNFIDGVYNL